jgi:hypothetical protein
VPPPAEKIKGGWSWACLVDPSGSCANTTHRVATRSSLAVRCNCQRTFGVLLMIRITASQPRYRQVILAGMAALTILQPFALAQDRNKKEMFAQQAMELLIGYDQRAVAAINARSVADLRALSRDLHQTTIAREKERVSGAVLSSVCEGAILALSSLVQRAVLKLKRRDRSETLYGDAVSLSFRAYSRFSDYCAKDAGMAPFKTGLSNEALEPL